MKNLLYAAAALLMAACQQLELPELTESQTEETKRFCFTIKGDFLNPEFADGKHKANAYMTADGTEMTDLWVIDMKDGAIKQSLHQTKDDADWGAPAMSLTLGTHHILFLASRGQGAQYADGQVTWQKPLDTFFLDYEVTVAKTSNGNRAVTLQRIATKATIYIEDAIPAGTTTMTLTPTRWYTGWDMLTATPISAPSGYCVPFAVPEAYAGVTGVYYSIWSLSSTTEWPTDITIESRTGSTINATATILSAPMLANRTTIYRGALYTGSEQSSVSLNADWLQSYEGIY